MCYCPLVPVSATVYPGSVAVEVNLRIVAVPNGHLFVPVSLSISLSLCQGPETNVVESVSQYK